MLKKELNFKIPTLNKAKADEGFYNPLADTNNPDPRVVYCHYDECYYGISSNDKKLLLYRGKTLDEVFRNNDTIVVCGISDDDETYGYFWAPELHLVDGWWYIYTSTKNKDNNKKHMIVLKAKSKSPFDEFEPAVHLNKELYAIDPTVYTDKKSGKNYISFSFVVPGAGVQKLAIQELETPTTLKGDYIELPQASYPWELKNSCINEGSFFIEKDNRLFIVYSANGCWCDDYCLGIFELTGDNILDANSWIKNDKPILVKGNGNFGPGHATFFKSPDESELWISFHCLHDTNPSLTPTVRHCHCQKVFFDNTGFPHIGIPLPKDFYCPEPSNKL